MASGFTPRGRGRNRRYAARLDADERSVVTELMTQVLDLIAPGAGADPDPGQVDRSAGANRDAEFDAIVAGLGTNFGPSQVPDSPADLDGLASRGLGAEARDPALDRLFPAGHREDEAMASEFRRLTEDSLRRRKVDNLRTAIGTLGRVADDRVELTEPEARAFLVALTDVRLVLGDRLGLREDADAERLDEYAASAKSQDPAAYAIMLYDFLTWLQETLALALLPRPGRLA